MDIADILHSQRNRYYAHVTYFDQMVIAYGELSWWMRSSIHLCVIGGAMTIGFWSPLLAGLVYSIYVSLSGFLWAQYTMMEKRFEQMTVDIEISEKNLKGKKPILDLHNSTNRADIHESSALKARAWAYIQKMEAGNI